MIPFLDMKSAYAELKNELDAAYFARGNRQLRAELMQMTRLAEAKRIRDEFERFRRTDGIPVPTAEPDKASTIPPANQELLRLAGFSEEEARELAHYRGVLYSEGT